MQPLYDHLGPHWLNLETKFKTLSQDALNVFEANPKQIRISYAISLKLEGQIIGFARFDAQKGEGNNTDFSKGKKPVISGSLRIKNFGNNSVGSQHLIVGIESQDLKKDFVKRIQPALNDVEGYILAREMLDVQMTEIMALTKDDLVVSVGEK